MLIRREFREAFVPMLRGERETYATVLLGGLLKLYGPELLNWDGLTIEMEVKRDLDTDMPRVVYDQVQGLLTALTTDLVYHDVATFDQCVNALTRAGVSELQDVPSVEDVAWSVSEILLNDPEPVGYAKDKLAFGPDIIGYCETVLRDEGFVRAPTSLKFVDLEAAIPEYTTDPTMFGAAWQNQSSLAEAVDAYVEKQLAQMFADAKSIGLELKV